MQTAMNIESLRDYGMLDGDALEALWLEIDRLRIIEVAARNLCEVKGRHHAEIAYKRLASALTTNA